MSESKMQEMKRLAGITSQFPDWNMQKAKPSSKKGTKTESKKPRRTRKRRLHERTR